MATIVYIWDICACSWFHAYGMHIRRLYHHQVRDVLKLKVLAGDVVHHVNFRLASIVEYRNPRDVFMYVDICLRLHMKIQEITLSSTSRTIQTLSNIWVNRNQ